MRLKVAIAIGLGALVAAPLVLAQVQDRIPLRGQSGNPSDHYSPTLAIVAVSPPEYKRGCCYDSNGGEWVGPHYQATGRPSLGGDSKYDWTVGLAIKAAQHAQGADRQPDPRLAGRRRGQAAGQAPRRRPARRDDRRVLDPDAIDVRRRRRRPHGSRCRVPALRRQHRLRQVLAAAPLGQLGGRKHRLRRVRDQGHAPERLERGEGDAGDPRHLARGKSPGRAASPPVAAEPRSPAAWSIARSIPSPATPCGSSGRPAAPGGRPGPGRRAQQARTRSRLGQPASTASSRAPVEATASPSGSDGAPAG